MKKLDGGLKTLLILILFFLILTKNTFGTQILDYETEDFINELLQSIQKVNNINREIKFKIINDDEINASVNEQNIIHINAGLIHYCKDYVALLSVLAHEVGHIDLNHIYIRKKIIGNSKKYNNLALLSVLAGSAISQNQNILQTSIISSAIVSSNYIEFSKEQEIEADLYALKTLDLLNTNSNSVIELLQTIEDKLSEKGFSKDKQRISTHPYFNERFLLINNYRNNKKNILDPHYNERFNFIKSKFIGYSNNSNLIKNLKEPYKTYAESIKIARNGNLKMSLENLNGIIKKNNNNFLLETKADILFSYGYTDEAIKFYKKNLEKYPLNYYAQIRIFENLEIKKLSDSDTEIIFQNNKDLLYKYFNNKNVLVKYIELAKKLNKTEWLKFFNFVLSINNIEEDVFETQITNFKKSKNKDLLRLVNIIQNIS